MVKILLCITVACIFAYFAQAAENVEDAKPQQPAVPRQPAKAPVAKSPQRGAGAISVAALTPKLKPKQKPTEPPPPPPPKSCDDEGRCEDANTKCNAESKCVCDVHFREISNGTCVPKPQLGEPCLLDEITWLSCDGQGVDVNCFSGEGPNRGKCVCTKGYEPSKTEKNCQPIRKKLSETCSNDAECVAAYGLCNKGKCSCSPGFTAANGICKPAAYQCPSGKATKGKDNGVIVCEVDFNEQTGTIGDNCGTGQFCFVPPHTLSETGKPKGHCCPTPSPPDSAQSVCPFGEHLKNATCPDRKAGSKEESTCPSFTHQCFSNQFRPHDMICCPNPCRQSVSHFDFSGQCYDYALLGRACELNAQCTGDAQCVNSGGRKVCQCKNGYEKLSANQCAPKRK